MMKWKDSSFRTTDETEMVLLEAEKNHWRDVLTRLISIIQSLAVRNLAHRGSGNTLHQDNNGKFLKEVELITKFDPVFKRSHEWSTACHILGENNLDNLCQ